jgi:hypothetical protein
MWLLSGTIHSFLGTQKAAFGYSLLRGENVARHTCRVVLLLTSAAKKLYH